MAMTDGLLLFNESQPHGNVTIQLDRCIQSLTVSSVSELRALEHSEDVVHFEQLHEVQDLLLFDLSNQ